MNLFISSHLFALWNARHNGTISSTSFISSCLSFIFYALFILSSHFFLFIYLFVDDVMALFVVRATFLSFFFTRTHHFVSLHCFKANEHKLNLKMKTTTNDERWEGKEEMLHAIYLAMEGKKMEIGDSNDSMLLNKLRRYAKREEIANGNECERNYYPLLVTFSSLSSLLISYSCFKNYIRANSVEIWMRKLLRGDCCISTMKEVIILGNVYSQSIWQFDLKVMSF